MNSLYKAANNVITQLDKLAITLENSFNKQYLFLFTLYNIFGAIHEITHGVTALILIPDLHLQIHKDGLWQKLVTMILFERRFEIPFAKSLVEGRVISIVRHTGWIMNFILALQMIQLLSKKKDETRQFLYFATLAAQITAIEAISTDLLGIPVLSSFYGSAPHYSNIAFFCGNFGAIFINSIWMTADGGKSALELLEKMVSITQIRGAQSGGIVTFLKHRQEFVGVRSRVVNGKRTDLSKELKKKMKKDVFTGIFSNRKGFFSNEYVHSIIGHTRFATSSKATLSGTHPHTWSGAKYWKYYDTQCSSQKNTKAKTTRVENYVTHNGDFEFFEINGFTYEIGTIQKWIEIFTQTSMPSTVDSAAIAGLVDILRSKGCFGLSIRFVVCFGLPKSRISEENRHIPTQKDYEKIGLYFEEALDDLLKKKTLDSICESAEERKIFASLVLPKLQNNFKDISPEVRRYITDDEGGANIRYFISSTIDAFFDNDLFFASKFIFSHAKGSFGLCVTSSLDTKNQICLAARGQTMSVAFYPIMGFICYGSEQAAVKAGMSISFPGKGSDVLEKSHLDIDNDSLRLDLDDLGGEICIIDWKNSAKAISPPNRQCVSYYRTMNKSVNVILYQESKTTKQPQLLYHRMTRLTRNEFISPLPADNDDLVLNDIRDIPRVCQEIQDDWRSVNGTKSLSINRLSAWNLARCVRQRLNDRINGLYQSQADYIDILLTGCEVSLWLAEQFASDLQKAFPKLSIKALSSNKILALYGQETTIPATGFSFSYKTQKLDDSIVFIVSHSGGTFAPLACSSLLQSFTKNIFVVASEWDTQIGKQLRRINEHAAEMSTVFFNSHRIFSTGIGMRPAEPSSVSVAATHQLLTNIFEHICVVILSSHQHRHISGAVITERDLKILECCNRENIKAISSIVGVDEKGNPVRSEVERELRKLGDIWSQHILENVKAYIISFFYIFATVVAGYPIIHLIFILSRLETSKTVVYFIRFLDACVYFFLPQINVLLIRLIQGRNLVHRMVGRTVVIGDIPWVSQAADAFLSKLFACSYSIAGLNVLSGNPSDHLVHRHTHRVVRGTLLVCGRPDGRLSALSSSETTVSLSVNQACSIQSLGGTAECITIGHNPFKLPLSKYAIFLERNRPLFLCERFLDELDRSVSRRRQRMGTLFDSPKLSTLEKHHGNDVTPQRKNRRMKQRSSAALTGAYKDLGKKLMSTLDDTERLSATDIANQVIQEQRWADNARTLFESLDTDGNGFLDIKEFLDGFHKINNSFTSTQINKIFEEADLDESSNLSYKEFTRILKMNPVELDILLQTNNRDSRGLIQIEPSSEKYFGEKMREHFSFTSEGDESFFSGIKSQYFSQELYESRIASHQRFVAMTVLFHQIASQVQNFFRIFSLGLLGYRIDRTHSVMRIATTASPVSGAEVRERMYAMQLVTKVTHSINVISKAWLQYKMRKNCVN